MIDFCSGIYPSDDEKYATLASGSGNEAVSDETHQEGNQSIN